MVQVPPDKYLVVIRRGKPRRVVRAGSTFINPLMETYAFIPADVRTLELVISEIESSPAHKGATFNVRLATRVKLSHHEEILLMNAEHLMGMTDEEINETALRVLEDLIRRYAKDKTPMELSGDRETFSRNIRTWANNELREQGIEVMCLVIKEMDDENGYFDSSSLGGAQGEGAQGPLR